MAQPYSDDLRCKLLEAYEAGVGGLRELAAQFRVSWGYSKKIRVQQLHTGQKERPVQLRHGPPSRITEEVKQQLRNWLGKQPDLTLAELRDRLDADGVHVSRSLVGQAVQQMGLRRKNNPSTPKSKIRKKAASAVRRGGSR